MLQKMHESVQNISMKYTFFKCFSEGFAILQGPFNLMKWKNQDIQGIQFDLLECLAKCHVVRITINDEK